MDKPRTHRLLIQACLNGSREQGEHPALPLTPEELARDARAVVGAGACALHIHPRRVDGQQTLAAEDQAAALEAIRALYPGLPVGVSTALWIEEDVERRLQYVREWAVLPDFASVNFSEPGTAELCQLLLLRGIGVEAGLATVEDAQLLHTLGLAEYCLRILIEVEGERPEEALATANEIIRYLDEKDIQATRLLHGYGIAGWAVLEDALKRGYDTRIGLEDTLELPDGSQVEGNGQLVALAVQKAKQMGLDV